MLDASDLESSCWGLDLAGGILGTSTQVGVDAERYGRDSINRASGLNASCDGEARRAPDPNELTRGKSGNRHVFRG